MSRSTSLAPYFLLGPHCNSLYQQASSSWIIRGMDADIVCLIYNYQYSLGLSLWACIVSKNNRFLKDITMNIIYAWISLYTQHITHSIMWCKHALLQLIQGLGLDGVYHSLSSLYPFPWKLWACPLTCLWWRNCWCIDRPTWCVTFKRLAD